MDTCTIETCHFGGHGSLLAGNNYKLHSLSLTHTFLHLLRVVLSYGRLVDENVFTGVIAVYEAVAVPNIKPLTVPTTGPPSAGVFLVAKPLEVAVLS